MNESPVKRVAIVGTGVIGASWAAHFLAHGLDVVATDPAPGAESQLRAEVQACWPLLEQLGLREGASPDRLSFTPDPAAAVADAVVDLLEVIDIDHNKTDCFVRFSCLRPRSFRRSHNTAMVQRTRKSIPTRRLG